MNKTELQKKLAVEKEVLANLRQELESLRSEEKQLKIRLEEVLVRERAICGGFRDYGEIGEATSNIESLRRQIVDVDKPAVVWKKREWWSHRGDPPEYVVSRVTAKRVYIRERGAQSEDYYDKMTGESSHRGTIDITATFPEGVDNWKS